MNEVSQGVFRVGCATMTYDHRWCGTVLFAPNFEVPDKNAESVLHICALRSETMNKSDSHDQKIANMTFSSVYPHYVTKVERKGRTREELHQVINWLTGFDDDAIEEQIQQKVTFEQFFERATLNPNAHLITGAICGYRVEELENPLTQKARYLDKLVDELAKGRKMEKILRVNN